MDIVQIDLLGPVEARLGGLLLCLGGRKEQMVLAVLAVTLNQAVSTDSLVDTLWNGDPPKSGLVTLQSIVSRLRGRLGHDTIESINHSYRLAVEPEQIDAVRFEHLVGQASSLLANDPSTAASLASEALALWRGTPFGDLSDTNFLDPHIRRLQSFRLSALEVRLDADVQCGRLTSAIATLKAEIVENPFRERLWYLLVLALARDGCRVDALRACHQLRADLAKLGLEPSGDIGELEQMILDETPAVRAHLRH